MIIKDINVHCELLKCDVMDELSKAGIYYLPSSTKIYLTSTAVNKMTTLDQDPMNIAVIAKPKPELVRVLKCLKSWGHTPLLIHLPDAEERSFSVESLLAHAHLVLSASDSKEEEEDHLSKGKEDHPSQGEEEDHLSKGEEDTSNVEGGPYNYYYPSEVEEEEVVEDPYKILDFLEPIRPTVKGAMTAVFWDAQYCPFPLGSTADDIYHSIASALVERKFTNKISIWAYLGDDDKNGSALLGDKTWASRIYFFPAGDKASRRIRMTNDILFWAQESRCQPFRESLFIVSDQFRGDPYYVELLHNLVSASLRIFCITPTQDINKPESPEWPGLFFDEAAYRLLFETSEIPDEPCSKKRKTDAGMLFMMEVEEETSGMELTNEQRLQYEFSLCLCLCFIGFTWCVFCFWFGRFYFSFLQWIIRVKKKFIKLNKIILWMSITGSIHNRSIHERERVGQSYFFFSLLVYDLYSFQICISFSLIFSLFYDGVILYI